MVQVIDDFLEDHFLVDFLYKYFLYAVPHRYTETSGQDDNYHCRFYCSDFSDEDIMIQYLCQKLFKKNIIDKFLFFGRINLNVQHKDMGEHSPYHQDGTEKTVVYMLSPEQMVGGNFQYLNEDGNSIQIEYKRNRLLIFDGQLLHKALPPKNNVPRVTLAFKTLRDRNAVL